MTARSRPRNVVPVALADLAAQLGRSAAGSQPVANPAVSGITLSSQSVLRGDMYAALPGANTHGARFAADAVRAGAVALLTDRVGAQMAGDCGAPVVVVDDPRQVLGLAAAIVYGDPASAVTLIGVTGTQGKTTTTQLIHAGLGAAGRRAAVIGTMGTWIGDQKVSTALTTPEATDLHALLAVMLEEGVEACAMEVSSHALVMGRVDGVVFDLAAFTNFGRDHLDFHRDEDDYFLAKAALFSSQRAIRALVNLDDPRVATLLDRPALPTSTFSPSGAEATWRAVNVEPTGAGSRLTVEGPGLALHMRLRLPGDFNVANALCAVACVGELADDPGEVEAAADGIASVAAVPGRMEPIDRGQDFLVLVDYAHKPDAISATLRAVRGFTTGDVTIVLGAGGDRDAGKRPLMGDIAASLADTVIVTDDNPRQEDPAAIRADILDGIASTRGRGTVLEIGDRHAAIAAALGAAKAGDTVVIAGKGHETGQQIGDQSLPFDDRVVAAEVLEWLQTGAKP